MKIESMTPELQGKLWDLWQQEQPNMTPELQKPDAFLYLLSQTDDSDWWIVDNTVLIFDKIVEGWQAELIPLGLDRVNRKRGVEELQTAMEEYDLQRLTFFMPRPVRKLNRAAHRLGFRTEGVMKNATFFEGTFADLSIYGLYRGDNGTAAST